MAPLRHARSRSCTKGVRAHSLLLSWMRGKELFWGKTGGAGGARKCRSACSSSRSANARSRAKQALSLQVAIYRLLQTSPKAAIELSPR
jgi:hypothetical protein